MAEIIDLRSDTVTKPTAEMRQAMARAEVGDDCYGEDPTLNELEAVAAEIMGKERAVYVPSGTMGNLVALLGHTQKGDEVILDAHAHIYEYEVGGFSAVAGLSPRLIETHMGVMTPEGLAAALRGPYSAFPPTTLLCLENTNNYAGGAVMSSAQMAAVTDLARQRGLAVHLDGARIFNAATALGVDVKELTQHVDSVMFCLSKALSAPVGSLLAGSAGFVERARKARRMVGGGLRQAGVLASAGLVALRTMTRRLQEDHDNALALAQGLSRIEKLGIDLATVQTNMVNVDLSGLGMDSAQFLEKLGHHGIKANPRGPHRIRLVTHRHITAQAVERAVAAFAEVAA
jgi:threonine aldolase